MVRLCDNTGLRGHERLAAWVAFSLLGAGLVLQISKRSGAWLEPSENSAVRRFTLAPMAPGKGLDDVQGFSQGSSSEEDGSDIISVKDATSEGTKFYIYPDAIFRTDSALWQPVPEVARRAACFVDAFEAHGSRTQDPEEASLFIVPMYRLWHILSSINATAITVALDDLRNSLYSSNWHLKYGGANHVFAFAESLGDHTREMVVSTLDVDLRSFWAQVGSLHNPKGWRCPNRYVNINLPETPTCEDDMGLMTTGDSSPPSDWQSASMGNDERREA